MTVETAMRDASDKMDKAIGVLKDDLAGIRTGRATPALLSRLVVDYYGVLNNLGVTLAAYRGNPPDHPGVGQWAGDRRAAGCAHREPRGRAAVGVS